MGVDITWFAHVVTALAINYLVHSTILLASVWLLVRLLRSSSHTLDERLWKLASVLALVTVPIQFTLGSPIAWKITIGAPVKPAAEFTPPIPAPLADIPASITSEFDGRSVSEPEPVSTGITTALTSLGDGKKSGNREFNRTDILLPDAAGFEGQIEQMETLDEGEGHLLSAPSTRHKRCSNSLPDAAFWCGMLLLAYIAVCFVVLTVRSMRLSRRLNGWSPSGNGPARRILESMVRRHTCGRSIRLLESDECQEPVVFGAMRWTIVLPPKTEQRLTRDELRAILAHEVAHLVRGDLWWLWIGRLLCSCLAFQPLNVLARRRWRQASECLCDDWAMQQGVSALSLARCLTRVAEWKLEATGNSLVLAASGTKTTLIRRVERLTNHGDQFDAWATPRRQRLLRSSGCLITVAFFALAPRVGLPSPDRTLLEAGAEAGIETHRHDAQLVFTDLVLLDEEVEQLEADLDRVATLLDRLPPDHRLRRFTESLDKRAQRMRAHRNKINSLSIWEPHQ
jgi:hypothetical protein